MPIILVVGTEEELQSGKGQRGLTTTQAAARLGISERSLRLMIARKDLKPYPETLFKMLLFLEHDVEELRDRRLRY